MRELVCPRHMCKVPLGKCMEWDIDEVTGERIQCNEKPVMSTTLYWCKQCNVPIYEESCPLCGEKGKYIATDIRPVFPEEKILLAILLEKDDRKVTELLSDMEDKATAIAGAISKLQEILGGIEL